MEKVTLAETFTQFDEAWTPKIVASLNDYDVQLAKYEDEFVWHKHDDTDDLFLVIRGRVVIQLRDRDVELGPGELFVVPKGVEQSADAGFHSISSDGDVRSHSSCSFDRARDNFGFLPSREGDRRRMGRSMGDDGGPRTER